MNLLRFIQSFHVEVAKLLDRVEAAGEANGLMEWVNGNVGSYEVYFLWFPKTKKLVYVVVGPGVYKEEELDAASSLEAIAQAERVVARLR
ncbi:MAG: hypothetical protein ABWK05_01640 [Pyrobaculum sp.]